MATYSVNTTGDLSTQLKIISGTPQTNIYRRSYLKFNITNPPFTLSEITSVQIKVYCSYINLGTATIRLRSSINNGWGSTLDANFSDYNSTDDYIEDDVSVTGTGFWYFDVDKNHLNLNGWTYFRLSYYNEGNQGRIDFTSQNGSPSTNRPTLIIKYEKGGKAFTQAYIF